MVHGVTIIIIVDKRTLLHYFHTDPLIRNIFNSFISEHPDTNTIIVYSIVAAVNGECSHFEILHGCVTFDL